MTNHTIEPIKNLDTGLIATAWIVAHSPEILTCPSGGRPVDTTARFGDRFYLSQEEPREIEGKTWMLLVQNVGDSTGVRFAPLGWVGQTDILEAVFPLQNPKKALITNKGAAGGRITVPVYFNPWLKGETPAHKTAIGSVYYIYDGYPREAVEEIEETNPEEIESLLIGYLPALSSFDDNAGLGLLGWVDRKYVTLWNTREALTLNGKIPIYGTKEDAKKQDRSGVIAVSSGKEIEYDTMRNPILKAEEGLYKIGFFGRIDLGKTGFGQAPHVEKIRLEIHYVLDVTRSMSKWLRVAKRTVEKSWQEISEMAERLNLPSPTYGITFYRDRAVRPGHPQNSRCAEEVKTHPQTSHVGEFLETLEREPACDWDRDGPESVYDGLLSAIGKARFDNYSYRLIVHLGDAGDHGRGASHEAILTQMTQNRINYFAFDVSPEGTALSTSVRDLVGKRLTEHADAALYIDTVGVEEKIEEALKKAARSVEKQTEVLEAKKLGIGGEGGTVEAIFSDKVYKQVMEMFDMEGITFIEGQQLRVYEEGWVNPADNKGQKSDFNPTLLVAQNDILKLIGLLVDIVDMDPTPRTIRKVWSKLIEDFTGDICNPDEKIQRCFDRAGVLTFKSDLLQYSLHESANNLQADFGKFKRLQCDLKLAKAKLSGILEEKEYEYSQESSPRCQIRKKYRKERRYWYTTLTNDRLAWIDANDMP